MPPGSFYIRRPTFMRPVHAVIHTVEYALRCKLCNNKVTFHTHTSIKANAYFYFLLKCVLLCLSFSHKPTIPHTHTLTNTSHTPPTPLTLADVLVLFEARFAHTPPDGNQPASVSTAVHLGSLKLLRGVNTHTVDLHQRCVSACYCVGELGQVKHSEGTLLVKDPD